MANNAKLVSNVSSVNNMSSIISADSAFIEAYTQLVNKVMLESGDPSFTRFMQAMTQSTHFLFPWAEGELPQNLSNLSQHEESIPAEMIVAADEEDLGDRSF